METNSRVLVDKIKNKEQLYGILSKTYYLPDFNSKAVTKAYLVNYVLKEIPIWTMKKQMTVHHYYRYRKYNSLELLEILEKMLKERKLPPTGLDIKTLPDQEWLSNAILHLDPKDPHQLIRTKQEEKTDYTLEVNSE